MPLRLEQVALRVPAGTRVLHTGMGAGRARIAAARALAIDARAVAVAGLCGGVAPEVHPGDIVCATELRREDAEPIKVPSGAELAAAFHRRGLRVHAGPVLSLDRLAGPAERRSLVPTGALAVDMESAWLAAGARGRPFAVARVVVDAAGRALVDPRLLYEGPRALIALRDLFPTLSEWAAEAGAPPEPGPAQAPPPHEARASRQTQVR